MIQQFDDAVQMSTKPEQYENLIRIAKVPKKMTLSDSVMETLSIIAYKQPITKVEVEGIRGVSCDYAINKLLEYDLIKELGRKDAPGRPILFGTTEQFLRSFGVKNLTELPSPRFRWKSSRKKRRRRWMTALESDFRYPDRKSFVKIFTLHVRFCKSLCYNTN